MPRDPRPPRARAGAELHRYGAGDVLGATQLAQGVETSASGASETKEMPTDTVAVEPVSLLVLSFEVYASRVVTAGPTSTVSHFRENIATLTHANCQKWLRRFPFFDSLDDSQLLLLAQIGTFLSLGPDVEVLKQGTIASSFYILLHGSLNVTLKDDKAEAKDLGQLQSGALFGESALLGDVGSSNNRRGLRVSASVHTSTQCLVLRFHGIDFKQFLRLHPHCEAGIAEVMKLRDAGRLKALELPIFEGLSPSRLAVVLQAMETVTFGANDYVFSHGDAGDYFYVLLQGVITITDDDDQAFRPRRQEIPVAADAATNRRVNLADWSRWTPRKSEEESPRRRVPVRDSAQVLAKKDKQGDYFGEMALISAAQRNASALATESSTCARLPCDIFRSAFMYSRPASKPFARCSKPFKRTTPGKSNAANISIGNTLVFSSRYSTVAAAEFEIKALRSKASCDSVLSHPLTSGPFKGFLEKEHAEENYLFWDAVRKYRDDATVLSLKAKKAAAVMESAGSSEDAKASLVEAAQQVAHLATAIFDLYVRPGASRMVNLPSKLVKVCKKKLDSATDDDDLDSSLVGADLYDGASSEIVKMMQKDNLTRFVMSDEFDALLEDMGSYVSGEDAAIPNSEAMRMPTAQDINAKRTIYRAEKGKFRQTYRGSMLG